MLSNFNDACIHLLFELQVKRSPNAIAVIYEGKQLTYQELNSQANRLAHHLRSLGVGPEVLVAACVERSLECVVGLLAILKAGGAYVPLDPHYPPNRLAFMLEHSQTPVLLTQKHLVESLPEHQARVICLDGNPEISVGNAIFEENLESGVTPDNLAYVIYTSGSTGQPKGVAIEHRSAVNTLLDINDRFEVKPSDRVLAVSSLSFDLSVYDIFGVLAAGGTVVIPKASATPEPGDWLEVMTRERVTLWDSAPPLMQMLVDYTSARNKTLPSSLRLVLLSGDWIPLTLPDRIKDLVSRSEYEINLTSPPTPLLAGEGLGELGLSSTPAIVSLGGATEASIWSILYPIVKVEPDWKSIPYGRAMKNQHFYVLNEAMEPCQQGEAGQLYIGGIGLARCYWRDPKKTSQRFITHPQTGERLYCTGDLGCYLPDGNIEFIGRIDNQVKIRGFRIELGEIDAVLNQHPDVQVAVVTAQEEMPGQKRLVAFVVSKHTVERIPFRTEAILLRNSDANAEVDGDESVKVQTEDISIGGIGLVDVPDNWSKGQSVRLRLRLPGNTDECCFEGSIAWCQGKQAGIELSLTPTEQELIQQSIDYLLETQGFLKFLQRTTAGKLRSFLKDKLPDYMMPSSFVFLNSLPLTPNGKIDRQKLVASAVTISDPDREPDLIAQTAPISDREPDFVAPQTPVEEVLARIWAEVLGLERVGIYDNFFELGGHSLLVTQVVTRMRDAFQVELPLRTVFESPTIVDLARSLEIPTRKAASPQTPAIQPISRHQDLLLSFSQQQLWFVCQMAPQTPIYNEPFTIHLPGSPNIAAIERSIGEIIRRHEILRTSFVLVDGQLVMVVQDAPRFTLPIVNLQHLNEAERETEALRLATLEAKQPFDLTQGLLMRATLIQLGEADCRLFLTIHHIVTDAVSLYSVFLKELAALYSAFCLGLPSPLPELPIQFADFASWQRQCLQEEVIETQLAYWKQQLADLPVLQLPTDRSRSLVQTFQGARQCLTLPLSLTEMLEELSRREGVTLFMTLMAAFQTLLYRYTGQTDIPVGTVTDLRNRQDLEGMIGYFLNTLIIRTDLSGNPSFKELLVRVREIALGAYAHQELPFQKLVEEIQPERNLSYNPLFQVAFSLQPPLTEMNGWTIGQLDVDTGTAKFDLYLELDERPSGIIGRLEYNTDLFDAATINRMVGHFQTLLEGIVANPEQKISQLPLLTEFERQQLAAWNDTHADYPHDACIHQLFEEQVERSPDAIALVFEDKQLTYKELNRRANQLAHHLRNRGIRPEVMVGICMERSLEMVIGILGILKAGGAYLPLDPTYPPERLTFMLEDGLVPLVLTQEKFVSMLLEQGVPLVCLDTGWKAIARTSEENPAVQVRPDNLAYVIYTSGSTGTPKGVLLEHQGLCNLATAQIRIFDVQPVSRVLQFASLSFDASVSEIFMALLAGATLVLARRDSLLPGDSLIGLLQDQAITTVTLPPSVLAVLPAVELPALQTIIVAGEACSPDLAARWASGRRLFNAYGPTEATVCTTVAEVTCGDEKLPIGKAIANTHCLLLDAQLQPVPIGIPGEIYIGGAGVARGYLNRPELTTEKFISDDFLTTTSDRLYKTGDLARYLPDGNIEFLGRIDYQVKIRGFRIELGEIETALSQHHTVRQAVVLKREDVPGDKRLVAYVVPEEKPIDPSHQLEPQETGQSELWPSVAEYFVYDELLYYAMTNDERRNHSYKVGINQLVKDKVVVEIGTGKDAILARFCVEAGAKKIYAIERSEESYRLAKACIEKLGWQHKITLIHGDATQVNLPEQADVCLSEIVGAIGGCEGAAVILNSTRRFLKEDGVMIPQRSVTKIAAACLPDELLNNPRFTDVTSYYTDKIFEQIGYPFDLRLSIKKFPKSHIISNGDIFEDLNFDAYIDPEYRTEINLTIEKESRLDGFLVWLNLHVIEGEVIDIVEHEYCWLPVYLPVFSPGIRVSQGDTIKAICIGSLCDNHLNPDYKVEGVLTKKSGEKIEFKYESFHHKKVFKHNPFYERLFSQYEGQNNRHEKLIQELRDDLKQYLPEYMIPAKFVFVDKLPLTPNGKVDRKALPRPDALNPASEITYVAPQTEIEQAIATVWQQVLNLEKVGVDDNFFDLGGHSLLMAQVHSKLREAVGKDVSIIEMFKYPTISSLAKYLSQKQTEQASAVNSQECSANKLRENRIQKQKAALNRQKQKQQLQGKE